MNVFRRFPPFREFGAVNVAKALQPSPTTRIDQFLPTFEEFVGAQTEELFATLVGEGGKTQ